MRIGLQSWGSEGDVQPFTALAAGLVRAGHEVTLVVTDNAARDYSHLARHFGYRLISVPNPIISSRREAERVWRSIIALGNPIRQAEYVLRYGFDPAVEAMYAAAEQLCSECDAVVGHFFVYPLRVAAEKAGIAAATLNIVHNCIPSDNIPPPGVPHFGQWSYALGWRLTRFMVNRIFLPRVNRLRLAEGLSADSDVMRQTWAAPKLNLIAVSPLICQAPPDWDPRHRICGFLNSAAPIAVENIPDGLDEFLSRSEPPAYFTYGSMMIDADDFTREVATVWRDAAHQAGCRAVLQLPYGNIPSNAFGPNFFVVPRAPYKKVFPQCSMIIHHGGAGTTQSALLTGRPSIVVAHVSDQRFWGSELERLGVAGKTLKRHRLSAKRLAAGIRQVLTSPHLVQRATVLGGKMAHENGVANAVELIEKNLQ